MAENSSDQGGKQDWSRVDALLDSGNALSRNTKDVARPYDAALAPAPADKLDVPTPLVVPRPDLVAAQGIIAKLQANHIGRKAALEQLKVQYNGQLDVLKETVSQAVKVHKTRIGVAAEEYLRTLDSKHLELLTKLGARNTATRSKALSDLTDMTVAKIKEVEGKDWPQSFIDDTLEKLFALRERVANEIMKELGSEYSDN